MLNDYEFERLIEDIIKDYKGDGSLLSAALGVLVLGRYMGWRAVYIMHTESTMRKYQDVLGVVFKDVLPERTLLSDKSIGLAIVDKLDNFWRVVQGRDKSITREQKTQFN